NGSNMNPAVIAASGAGGAGAGGSLYAGLNARNNVGVEARRRGEPNVRDFSAPKAKPAATTPNNSLYFEGNCRYLLFYSAVSQPSVNQVNNVLSQCSNPFPETFDWTACVTDISSKNL